jgi:hypothetical protein
MQRRAVQLWACEGRAEECDEMHHVRPDLFAEFYSLGSETTPSFGEGKSRSSIFRIPDFSTLLRELATSEANQR